MKAVQRHTVVFDCVTIFPEMFGALTQFGITRRAKTDERWDLQCWNPRDFAENAYRTIDDRPYGGGPGMVMLPGPLEKAIAAARHRQQTAGCAGSHVIYLSPQGQLLTHQRVMALTALLSPPALPAAVMMAVPDGPDRQNGSVTKNVAGAAHATNVADVAVNAGHEVANTATVAADSQDDQVSQNKGLGLILLCGRYEGVDERLLVRCVDEEVSVGDFVLSGGELPAMLLMDAIIRQLPGVLGDASSAVEDSFVAGLLDCPHYTRPEVYEGMPVPEVLLSGDHQKIRRWRLKQSMARTRTRRPALFAQWQAGRILSVQEAQLLAEIRVGEQCGEQ